MARHRKTLVAVLGGMLAMGGLTAASVPLYRYFCQVTGAGGTPQTKVRPSDHAVDQAVTVRFDASLNKDMPWRFHPVQRQVTAHFGENLLVFFEAENLSDTPVTGTATFNVTPEKIGRYFNKVECFCFTEQTLQPGEKVQMPVTFWVDPALMDDQWANEVRTITLSYTFFRAKDDKTARTDTREKRS